MRNRVLLVKDLCGSINTLMDHADSRGGRASNRIRIIEDRSSPANYRYYQKDLFDMLYKAHTSKLYDYVVYDDNVVYNGMLRYKGIKDTPDSPIRNSPAMLPTAAQSRLELDRTESKKICARLGLPHSANLLRFKLKADNSTALALLLRGRNTQGKKYVFKQNSGDCLFIGTLDEAVEYLDFLHSLRRKPEYNLLPDNDPDLVVEEFIKMDSPVELSLSFMCNGKRAIPMCTLTDGDARLFYGGMGSKMCDVGNMVWAGMNARKWGKLEAAMSQWVAESGYKGWMDVDVIVDLESGEYSIFEFMLRLGVTTFCTVAHLYGDDWFKLIGSIMTGEEPADIRWRRPVAAGVGLFCVAPSSNVLGASASGMPISYTNLATKGSDRYTAWTTTYRDKQGRRFTTNYNRVALCIGNGKTEAEAVQNAYNEVGCVEFTGKVYNTNVFNRKKLSDPDLYGNDMFSKLRAMREWDILPTTKDYKLS